MDGNKEQGSLGFDTKLAIYNMFLTEAIFEILAEKRILSGEDVLARVKKLMKESSVPPRWVQ